MSTGAELANPLPSAGAQHSGLPGSATVLAFDLEFGESLARALSATDRFTAQALRLAAGSLGAAGAGVVILAPGEGGADDRPRRLADLGNALAACREQEIDQVILVSSGALYGVNHHAIGFESEGRRKPTNRLNRDACWWQAVEHAFEEAGMAERGLVLRVPLLPCAGASHFIGRMIKRGLLIRYLGFNPPLQFLSISSLAQAIAEAAHRRLSGAYHVAPDDVVPLLSVLRCKGVRSIAVPRLLQRILRPLLFRYVDGVETTDQLDYLRYPWTLSGEKFARETGLRFSSRAALAEIDTENSPESKLNSQAGLPEFDRFGSDPSFYQRHGKSTFRFAEEIYWRIESRGFEHLPRSGAAIIVGPHRGFMPLDGVMMFHLIYRYTGRIVRFLIHPTLAKFPFEGRFFQQMACVMACKTNAERVLHEGNILGVYPEGIAGAFKMYREAYNFEVFGRPDYARWALKHDVPVIPFAIVGSAEIFPILGRLEWRWLKEWMEWPFFPITATFPFIPLPLPTKWHVQFLPPINPKDVKAEAERLEKDPVAVFVEMVRVAVDSATQEMLCRRRSVFFGNIWDASKG